MSYVWLLETSHKWMIVIFTKKTKTEGKVQLHEDYTVPFHVDAAGRSKRVEAVEDPVARYLDSPHWKNKEKLETEKKREATKDTETGRQHILEMNESWKVRTLVRETTCSCCSVPVTEALNES